MNSKRKRGYEGEESDGRVVKRIEEFQSRLSESSADFSQEDQEDDFTNDDGILSIFFTKEENENGNGFDEENSEDSVTEITPRNSPVRIQTEAIVNLSDGELSKIWDEAEHDNQEVPEIVPEYEKLSNTKSASHHNFLHPNILETWRVWTRSGIPSREKTKLLQKYKPHEIFKSPDINQEILITLNKRPINKDDYIRSSQNLLGSALTSLSSTMSSIIQNQNELDKIGILNNLNETAMLLTELFHFDTDKRRSNIISWKPGPVRDLLVKTKPDTYLFGSNLKDRIDEAQQAGLIKPLKPYVYRPRFNHHYPNNLPRRHFTSPYRFYSSHEEYDEERKFVINPIKQEPKVQVKDEMIKIKFEDG